MKSWSSGVRVTKPEESQLKDLGKFGLQNRWLQYKSSHTEEEIDLLSIAQPELLD